MLTRIQIIRHNEDMHNAAYIKTYMGGRVPQSSYESAGLPNGGGWGTVQNILFSNFNVQGANAGPAITQDTGDNGTYKGTSLMSISNVAFVNFTGYLHNVAHDRIASVSCSNVHPCYNIDFDNVLLHPSQNVSTHGNVSCSYVESGGVHGLPGC